MYIYKTTNIISGKIYIGLSKFRPEENPNYLGSGYLLLKAIKIYGKKCFSKEVLEESESKKYLLERERFWISYFNSRDREIGYNICEGGTWGDNWSNHPNRENYRKRCSERTSGDKNPRYGDHRTYEELYGVEKANKLKQEISKRFTGENNPMRIQEYRDKISIANSGYKNGNGCIWILYYYGKEIMIFNGIKKSLIKLDLGLNYQLFYKDKNDVTLFRTKKHKDIYLKKITKDAVEYVDVVDHITPLINIKG